MHTKPIIVEQNFNVSVEALWRAITELELMTQWFFENIPNFKPEVGFKTQFNVSTEERDFLHLWEIVEVETYKKIVYNWKYGDYPGNSFIYFELTEFNNRTILKVSVKITESFPVNIPEFTSESCEAGWNYFIKERLKEFIEKNN